MVASTFNPIFIATAAMLAGGGVWIAYPSHQAFVHDKFSATMGKLHSLEARLLHKFDKDQSGTLSADEMLSVSDELFGDGDQGFWTTRHIVAISVLSSVMMVIFGVIAFFLFLQPSGPAPNPIGTLDLTIVKCQNLLNVDEKSGVKGDKSDPYVEAYVGGTKFCTSTIKDNLNPEWKEKEAHTHTFNVNLNDKKKNTLSLYVFDAKDHMKVTDLFSKAKALGHAELNIRDMFGGNGQQCKQLTKVLPLIIDHVNPKDHSQDTHEQHGYITISGVYKPKLTKPVATKPH